MSVIITGAGFQVGCTVKFGGVLATSVVRVSPDELTCTPPAHAPGAVDVVVTNPDLTTVTLPLGYTYLGSAIFSADFTALAPGPHASLPGGLALQRASTRTCQVSAEKYVVGIGADIGCVEQVTNDESSRGLGFWFAATNILFPSDPPAAPSANWSDIPGTGSYTTGQTDPSGGTGGVNLVLNEQNAINVLGAGPVAGYTWSFWHRATNSSVASHLFLYNQGRTVDVGAYGMAWNRHAAYQSASSSYQFYEHTGYVSPLAVPAYVTVSGFQVESGKIASPIIPTTSAAATRAGERLYLAAGASAFPSGVGNLNFEFQAVGNITDYGLPARLLSDPNDSTTYVEITAARRLNIVIHGTSWSPKKVLIWSAGAHVKFMLTIGGICTAKFAAGQGAVDLGNSGAALPLVTPGGAVEFFCSGTTLQLPARIQRIEAYQAGSAPAWVGQVTTSRQTHNVCCDGDSLTYGVGISSPGLNGYPGQLGTALGAGYAVTNVGVSGQTLGGAAGLIVTAPTIVDTLLGPFQKNILIIWAGTNDIEFLSATGASCWALLQTYITARYAAGWDDVVVKTMLPRDPSNPTEATRQAYNALIRGGVGTVFDALSDVGADATIGISGDQNGALYSDAVHLTQAGQAVGVTYDLPAVLSLG